MKWDVIVSAWSGHEADTRLEVRAQTWVDAVIEARGQLGESRALPDGASCVVSNDGSLAVSDPHEGRTFMVSRTGDATAGDSGERTTTTSGDRTAKQRARASGTYERVAASGGGAAQRGAAGHVTAGQGRAGYGAASQGAPSGGGAGDTAIASYTLLYARRQQPDENCPIGYWEQAYRLPAQTPADIAETLLRQKFAELHSTLHAFPPGQLVKLAAFDHAWSSAPHAPPVVTLEWSDWRDEIIIDVPAASNRKQAAAAPDAAPKQGATQISPTAVTPPATTKHNDAGTPTLSPDTMLGMAFEASSEIASLDSPKTAMERTVRLAAEFVPSDYVIGCIYDIDDDMLRVVATTGDRAARAIGAEFSARFGAWRQATTGSERPFIVTSGGAHAPFISGVDVPSGTSPTRLLFVPVIHELQVLGVLQLGDPAQATIERPESLEVMRFFADQLAQFIHRDRLRQLAKSA